MIRPISFWPGPALLALIATTPALAQWQSDGVPVCIMNANQTVPVAVADGQGGAFVVWEDARSGTAQVYAQHLDALGGPLWAANGILVSSGSFPQYGPVAVGDGKGGVIIAWILSIVPGAYEGRGQRLDAAGAQHWGGGGIPITPGVAFPTKLAIIGDGRTPDATPAGAILAWSDIRSGTTTDVYVGAVSGNGVQRWIATACTAAGNQGDVCLASDGVSNIAGEPQGAIVAWRDYRTDPGDPDIFVQRINYAGVAQWSANGIDIAPGITTVREPAIVSAGAQNAIVCWPGPAAGRTFGLYADRAGSAGSWGGPIPLTTPNSSQFDPAVISDLAGGIIVTWDTFAAGLTRDVYAQRLDANGIAQWGTTGKLVCLSSHTETRPVIVRGRFGASAIVWIDNRNEPNGDLYAQLLDANGDRQWTPAGVPLCRVDGIQEEMSATGDTTGGAIVAWTDYRSGDADIYAQRVTGWGGVVGVDPARVTALTLAAPFPNPSHAGLALAFELPSASQVTAAVFDAGGRRIRMLLDGAALPAGRHSIAWDGKGETGATVASGVYWLAVRAGGVQETRRAVVLR